MPTSYHFNHIFGTLNRTEQHKTNFHFIRLETRPQICCILLQTTNPAHENPSRSANGTVHAFPVDWMIVYLFSVPDDDDDLKLNFCMPSRHTRASTKAATTHRTSPNAAAGSIISFSEWKDMTNKFHMMVLRNTLLSQAPKYRYLLNKGLMEPLPFSKIS